MSLISKHPGYNKLRQTSVHRSSIKRLKTYKSYHYPCIVDQK